MYNYNTNEGGLGVFIRDLVIKLIFVIILVLLLIWLFPMPNMQPFYDRIYTENITMMKDTAKEYYTNERMPVKVNDKVTMTLGEMVNKHLILNLTDKNGNTCDTEKSYVEVTKLQTEYALKTYLSCGDEYDYVIEYIGCHNVCTTCTPLTTTVTKTVAKTNTVVKTVYKEVEKPVTPTTETWILYGKASTTTTSPWATTKQTTGTTTINGITTAITLADTKSEVTDTELEEESYTLYSAMYITNSTTLPLSTVYPGDRLLDLDKIGVSDDAQDLDLDELDMQVEDWDYFSSTTTDYSRFLSTRYDGLYLGSECKYCSNAVSASQMRSASLTEDNFDITSIKLVWNDSYDTYQVKTRVDIDDKTGVTSFYDSGLGYNVYYVPHKFTITWNEPTDVKTSYYRYTTTVSYTDQWVLKGSSQETQLKANGYTAKDTKVVTK